MEAWNKSSEIKKNCFLSNYVLVDKIFNKFSPINRVSQFVWYQRLNTASHEVVIWRTGLRMYALQLCV